MGGVDMLVTPLDGEEPVDAVTFASATGSAAAFCSCCSWARSAATSSRERPSSSLRLRVRPAGRRDDIARDRDHERPRAFVVEVSIDALARVIALPCTAGCGHSAACTFKGSADSVSLVCCSGCMRESIVLRGSAPCRRAVAGVGGADGSGGLTCAAVSTAVERGRSAAPGEHMTTEAGTSMGMGEPRPESA